MSKDENQAVAQLALLPLRLAGKSGFVVFNGDGKREDSYTVSVIGFESLLRDPRNAGLFTVLQFAQFLEHFSADELLGVARILEAAKERASKDAVEL